MRKPISIAVGATDNRQVLIAVCDDGSVWEFDYCSQKWAKCDPIPGTEDDIAEKRDVLP